MSQIQGTDVVASMVVFEDGLARKSEYRRFAVRGNPDGSGTDDLSAMSEVMRRRFARYRARDEADARRDQPEAALDSSTGDGDGVATNELPGIDPLTGRPRRFAYPPQLVVVDGGQPQVNAVAAVLSDLGITDVALCGLAKRLEEVWLPGEDFPVILPRTSEALYLLQRVRDEAHRFAITFHRQRRSKRMTASASGQRARSGGDAAQGAAAPVRIPEAAGPGDTGGDHRGSGHRAADRGGGAGRAQPGRRRAGGVRGGLARRGPGGRGRQDQGRCQPLAGRAARAGAGADTGGVRREHLIG